MVLCCRSVAGSLACGVLPLAVMLRRTTPNLAAADDTTSRTATLRVRSGLLVVQTALAVVLLVGATLTVRSFHAIQRVQLGFDPEGLVTFDVVVPDGKYKRDVNRRFYRQALERVRQLPGISEASAVYLRPFEFGPIGSGVAVVLEGQSPRDRAAWRKQPSLNSEAVTPDYFRVMRIPLLEGRAFTERDDEHVPPVAIVSASAARRLWPGQNPIGKRLMASDDRTRERWRTVIGVVGEVRYRGLMEASLDLYTPYGQSEDAVKHFIVNASGAPSSTLGPLRAQIRSLDPDAVVDAIRPMRVVVDRQVAPWRFAALLFSLLAALALVVAVAGIYALLAYHVAERTREIGIRMALGARQNQIVWFIVLRTSLALGAGLLTGVVTALVAGRPLNALLFGVTRADPASYAIVPVLLLVAAAVGAWRPIRHAVAIDPVVALREK